MMMMGPAVASPMGADPMSVDGPDVGRPAGGSSRQAEFVAAQLRPVLRLRAISAVSPLDTLLLSIHRSASYGGASASITRGVSGGAATCHPNRSGLDAKTGCWGTDERLTAGWHT